MKDSPVQAGCQKTRLEMISMSPQHNKTIAVQFFMEQDKRKGPLAPEIVTSDYAAHIAGFPRMDVGGHSGFAVVFYQGFPDLYHTIDEVFAEGDKVVVRFTLRGHHTENFMGIPATGKAIEVPAIVMMTFAGDKIARLSAQFDQMGLMQQIGVIPALG